MRKRWPTCCISCRWIAKCGNAESLTGRCNSVRWITQASKFPPVPITLGLPRDGEFFGWDNEYEAHTVDVPAFAIDRIR